MQPKSSCVGCVKVLLLGHRAKGNGMKNVMVDKSFAFAMRDVNLYKHLVELKMEYVLSNQLLRSSTAVVN
jgi:hypothetical protein